MSSTGDSLPTSIGTVGLLHPGAMGATIGAACRADVIWCRDGRSAATVARAGAAGLSAVGRLEELVERSDLIVSVCPPAEAVRVADDVAATGFRGLYLDANAIAPSTARQIAERFDRFVDGGIVGPPAEHPGTTRLYLSGDPAGDVAELWRDSKVETRVIDGGAGAASALKMAYATWTKVSAALLLDVRALARAEGVDGALLDEWSISQAGTADRSASTARAVGPKAWRFTGEMEQIELAFGELGLPTGFAAGAADVYRRLSSFKDDTDVELDAVLRALARDDPTAG